jgi:hypothetical protein
LAYMRISSLLPTSGVYQTAEITGRLPTGCEPGSLQLKVNYDYDVNGLPVGVSTDDGKGNITEPQPVVNNGARVISGTVDYETGAVSLVVLWANGLVTGRVWVSYRVAAAVSQPTHTLDLPITLATRGSVFAQTLQPLPAKGTFFVDFRALGKWYRLRDDGTGSVSGDDPAYGVGTVDPITGAVVVTLGALPDVGSSVLMGWASPVHYTIRAGATSDAGVTVKQRIMLPDLPVKPNTVSIEYLGGAITYTATEALSGVISGGGVTGTINHATGELLLEYTTRLPNMDTNVTVSYQQEQPTGATPTSASGSMVVADYTNFTLDTDGGEIAPNGLRLTIPVRFTRVNSLTSVQVADNGLGQLITLEQKVTAGPDVLRITGGQVIGTVVYATGACSITEEMTATYDWWSVSGRMWVAASQA